MKTKQKKKKLPLREAGDRAEETLRRKQKKALTEEAGEPEVPKKYTVLIDRLAHLDVEKIFERLEDELKLDERKMGRKQLIVALNTATDNARLAAYLSITSKMEFEKFQLQKKKALANLSIRAREKLTAKRMKGSVSAQMVEEYCVANFPRFAAMEEDETEFKQIVRTLESLASFWAARPSILQTIARLMDTRDKPSDLELGGQD